MPSNALRLVFLFLTFAFGVIGGSVGLNALIEYQRQKKQLKDAIKPPITADVDASDILSVGISLSVACAVIAASAFFFMILDIIPAIRNKGGLIGAKIQGGLLVVLDLWLLGSLIAFTHFFATRSAKVTAFIGKAPAPEAAISAVEKSLGLTPVYKDIDYLRLPAIIPWITMLLTAITAVLLFTSSSHRNAANTTTTRRRHNSSDVDVDVAEKNHA